MALRRKRVPKVPKFHNPHLKKQVSVYIVLHALNALQPTVFVLIYEDCTAKYKRNSTTM